MSTEVSVADAEAAGIADVRARRAILRLALGVTGSFVVAEGLDWDFTFLGPMLCVQLLAKSTMPPTLGDAIGQLVAIALAMGASLLVTAAMISSPWSLVLAFLLVLYLSFYGQARGISDFAVLMLQFGAVTIPVLAVLSMPIAGDFATTLLKAMAVALVAVWIVHACFPDPGPGVRSARAREFDRTEGKAAAAFAFRNTLILAPMLAWYLLDSSQIALVLLITILMVIRQHERGAARYVAFGILLGNIVGGIAAALVYNVIQLQPSIVFFAMIVFASSLVFAARIMRGGPIAPVYATALATFILLLGLGFSPLPTGSEEAFISRLVNVLIATAYAVGGLLIFDSRQAPAGGRS
jgi:hypothetical protein